MYICRENTKIKRIPHYDLPEPVCGVVDRLTSCCLKTSLAC